MLKSITNTGKSLSFPRGMTVSGITSMSITILASVIIAQMLDSGQITWEQSGYWIMGMLLLSAFLGAKAAIVTIKRQKLAVSMMSGILYWGIMLCVTALFFGGNYDAVLETAALIIAGSGCAAMVSLPQKRSRRKRRRKV